MSVGAQLVERVIGPVTQTDIVRFAGACGDFNPLHHDQVAARRSGFDVPIAMGQWTAGLVGAWLADWCGVERLRSLDVRFAAALLIGDTLLLRGVVTRIDGPVARVEFTARRSDDVVACGEAQLDVS